MINVLKPSMTQREIDAVAEVLRSGWIGLGPRTEEFESRFARFIGVSGAVGLNSATAALDLAVRLLNIGPGDEVIVPVITFVSTAHAVCYSGGTPVFVDVDPRTLNMDLEWVRRKIGPRTKAIIPVHYGGRPVDVDALREVVGEVPIIEDCSHAAGAEWRGRKCGSLGDIGCFSFHAVKNIATGDGGMLTCSKPEWAERARRLRWLGISKGTWDRSEGGTTYAWEYRVDEIGLKCHMNDIMAAIGLVQLDRLAEMNHRRRQIVERYQRELSKIPSIETPPDDTAESQSAWHLYSIRCDYRNELSTWLKQHGVSTGVHYYPIHLYRCFGKQEPLPVAESVYKRLLTLPLYPDLTDEEVDEVIRLIKAFHPGGQA
ncbi:MAG: DegT/DnrJ/EryC1/StrS family aminotransferase [Verrucomicrobia bacterium]|nr:DegT/DnrJ/EryC1/StrS family aminotransferase [Verrucomicrobiota bacterium]